ncbi:MAG: aldehyde dehydrogenase family protein [Panacagrimonas sp.]
MQTFHLTIGGTAQPGAALMDVINPATGKAFTQCPRASADQLDAAVAAARKAFPAWSALTVAERASALRNLASGIQQRADEIAKLLTQEQGKPLSAATEEVLGSAAFIQHFASMELKPKVLEDNKTQRVEQHFTPLGVVASIVPWNFPLLMVSCKLAQGLITGNTMVAKPAPTTPLTTLLLGEIATEHLPAGVFNVITDQNDLGAQLTSHPDVNKVSFTGSTATGKKVMAAAAATVKRVTLELGGNDGAIVLDDADPKTVAPMIFATAFANSGQVCIAVKRLYVHEKIYEDVLQELINLADAAVVGNGLEEGTTHGPVQNKMQFEKVKALVEEAKQGGKVVAGGQISDDGGYFIRPTLVRDAAAGTKLVDEEQFGPILPIIKFSDVEDVIAQVNATPYGLGGSVWSSNTERAAQVAARIDSGTVWVNKHLDIGPAYPFGGAKQSGLGVEFSEDGLYEFTQSRILNIAKQ